MTNSFKQVALLLLFFISINLYSQDSTYYKFNLIIKNAEYKSEIGEKMKSLEAYDAAFKYIDFDPLEYYAAFTVAISDSNYCKANEYLIKGTLKGLDLSKYNGKEIDSFKKSKYANTYWQHKDSLLRIYFNSLDTVFYKAILEMFKLDQSKRGGKWRVQEEINDSLNFEKLIQLSKERGFPTFRKVGMGCNTVQLILAHNGNNGYPTSRQWEIILPLINKEIYNGTLDPNYLNDIEKILVKWHVLKK